MTKKGIPAMKEGPLNLKNVDKPTPKNSLFNVFPESGSVGVPLGIVPKIEFLHPMHIPTLTTENIMLFDGRGNRVGVKLEIDGGTVSINPEKELLPGSKYFVRVEKVRFADGKKVAGIDNSSHFVTIK